MRKAVFTITVLLTGCDLRAAATRAPDFSSLVERTCENFARLAECLDADGISDPACVKAVRAAAAEVTQ